jgi:uncharacterized protein YecE (DUF72 family)
MAIRIGTSGFIYEHWRHRFYPPTARGSELELYARTFDTVELNVTFYRMPPSSTFRSWAARVPEGFLFAVKASRYLTHVRRLKEPRPSVELLVERASELGCHLGPVLIQLPPDLELDLVGLEQTLDAFPAGIRLAVEPRHPSWFVDDVRGALTDRNVALCVADRRGPITPLWRTADWSYLRFHAGRATPRSCYGSKELDAWTERFEAGWGREATGFVYFNNDGNGCALRDASVYARALAGRGVEVASLPVVSDDVLLDPGPFVADVEGRAPAESGRPWGTARAASRSPSQPLSEGVPTRCRPR